MYYDSKIPEHPQSISVTNKDRLFGASIETVIMKRFCESSNPLFSLHFIRTFSNIRILKLILSPALYLEESLRLVPFLNTWLQQDILKDQFKDRELHLIGAFKQVSDQRSCYQNWCFIQSMLNMKNLLFTITYDYVCPRNLLPSFLFHASLMHSQITQSIYDWALFINDRFSSYPADNLQTLQLHIRRLYCVTEPWQLQNFRLNLSCQYFAINKSILFPKLQILYVHVNDVFNGSQEKRAFKNNTCELPELLIRYHFPKLKCLILVSSDVILVPCTQRDIHSHNENMNDVVRLRIEECIKKPRSFKVLQIQDQEESIKQFIMLKQSLVSL